MATGQWVEAANEAIRSIRDAGAKNRILVPGNNWSHGFGWAEPGGATDGVPNSVAMLDVVDPADNAWLDIHEYVNGSGPENDCVSRTAYSQALADVTAWLKDHHRQAFLGEFGTGPADECLAAIEDLLTFVERERDVWRGWAYFSAARGLEDKPMSIKPVKVGERESPQMVVLERHMASGG
jgi:endoglucanase